MIKTDSDFEDKDEGTISEDESEENPNQNKV